MVKPELLWRPKIVGDGRVMEILSGQRYRILNIFTYMCGHDVSSQQYKNERKVNKVA